MTYKNDLLKKAIQTLAISSLLQPINLLTEPETIDWSYSEKETITDIESFEVSDDVRVPVFSYSEKDGKKKVEKEIDSTNIRMFMTKEENQLKKIEQVLYGKKENGEMIFFSDEHFEVYLKEDRLEKEMRETQMDDEEEN